MIRICVLNVATRLFYIVSMLIVLAAGTVILSQTCGATDAQIVAGIYAEIKDDKGLASQVSHINVVSVNQAVKFQGWADSKKDYDKIVGFGMGASCVRMVNVNNFLETPPPENSPMRAVRGCAAGTKPCGDVCIPEGDACGLEASATLLKFLFPESLALRSGNTCGGHAY